MARDQYKGLSQEEKNKKEQHAKNWHQNQSEEEKL